MKAGTCTPIAFESGEHFFGRDSGLVCRSLQNAGVDCVCIMPGTPAPGEASDLIRASEEDLRSPAWWQSQGFDVVVLYAWGDPRFRKIATAIRSAGSFLIQNLDSAGIESPHADFRSWLIALSDQIKGPQPLARKLRLMLRGIRDTVPALYETRRLEMFADSDVLAAVSPPARDTVARYASALGFGDLVSKLQVLPHPVQDDMAYQGEPKEPRVICVGRWLPEDRHQKDPVTTLRVAAEFLREFSQWKFEIVGRGSRSLADDLRYDPGPEIRERLVFTDALPRHVLKEHYLKSRILFCGSRFESFHISSAEALCCGASIVVGDHPLLASTRWFTTRDSGTLAASRSVSDLSLALAEEARMWEQGKRDPHSISMTWKAEVSGKAVAGKVIGFVNESRTRNRAPK